MNAYQSILIWWENTNISISINKWVELMKDNDNPNSYYFFSLISRPREISEGYDWTPWYTESTWQKEYQAMKEFIES